MACGGCGVYREPPFIFSSHEGASALGRMAQRVDGYIVDISSYARMIHVVTGRRGIVLHVVLNAFGGSLFMLKFL